jgi:two-component system alkaline phosphatase synthesis response regulator PhoP
MPIKILIAEDDAQLMNALTEKLTLEGFEVIQTVDGNDCLKKGAETNPNLLLLDLLMPNKDGFEVLHDIMPLKWAKDIPVIVLSNLTDFSSQLESYNRGGDTYLIKANTSLGELLKVIKRKLVEFHIS